MQQKGASETLQKKGRWSFQIGRHITGLHHLHISNKIGSRMPPTRSHFGYFSDRTLIPKNQDKKVELLAAGGSKGQFKAATHSPQPCATPPSAAASPDNIFNSPHPFCQTTFTCYSATLTFRCAWFQGSLFVLLPLPGPQLKIRVFTLIPNENLILQGLQLKIGFFSIIN